MNHHKLLYNNKFTKILNNNTRYIWKIMARTRNGSDSQLMNSGQLSFLQPSVMLDQTFPQKKKMLYGLVIVKLQCLSCHNYQAKSGVQKIPKLPPDLTFLDLFCSMPERTNERKKISRLLRGSKQLVPQPYLMPGKIAGADDSMQEVLILQKYDVL